MSFSNTGGTDISLASFVLHDSKGPDDSKAFTFPTGATIAAGATITLCKDAEASFEFEIGGDDTVTLLDVTGTEIDTSGDQGALNYVWTRTGSTWGYQMFGTLEPTPPPTPALPLQPLQLTAVADKGSTGRCGGEAWIEFANTGDTDIL